MRLARVQEHSSPKDGSVLPRFALVDVDDRVCLLPEGGNLPDALEALRAGSTAQGAAGDAGGWTTSLDQWHLLAPVPSPGSVRDCVGFLQHVRNTRRSRGDLAPLLAVWQERPAFYFANPHSLRASNDHIAIPAGSQSFDFELEVAVVIGKGGRDLTPAQASDAIAGYVLFCDWSARDIQADERAMQIGLGKGKDAAISLGPWILSAHDAASIRRVDGLDIAVSAQVNGELVTDPEARYIGMDWTFEEIVAYASVSVDLVPGDLIAAGTVPTGCLLETSATSDFRGWLAGGDEVRLVAGPLGEIRSQIMPGGPVAQWRRA